MCMLNIYIFKIVLISDQMHLQFSLTWFFLFKQEMSIQR